MYTIKSLYQELANWDILWAKSGPWLVFLIKFYWDTLFIYVSSMAIFTGYEQS